jgi:uncharacterized cupin superfamily protein
VLSGKTCVVADIRIIDASKTRQAVVQQADRSAAGDAACWPAGAPIAHHVSNQSSEPCAYLIVGTRVNQDVCHYPDTGRTLHTDGKAWRLLEADGQLFKSGVF